MILFLFKTVESMVFDVMRMISTQIRWQDPCWSLCKLWEVASPPLGFYILLFKSTFFQGETEGKGSELQQRSVLLSTTHCTSHVCYISVHIRESKTVLDSGFHDTGSGLQVLDSSICQWNLDSGFQSLVGFRIPWAQDSGFHKQKFIAFPYLGWYMHHTAVI